MDLLLTITNKMGKPIKTEKFEIVTLEKNYFA